MRIRHGTPADIPGLMALERQTASAAHWSRQQYQTALANEALSRVVLILEEGGMQGFIAGRAVGEEWEIENIAVAEPVRRRGFGARLLAEFLDMARERGAEKVFLEVRESNSAARHLYEKRAFVQAGMRRRYYRDPEEDAIVYQFGFA
jgi:ribosomal-protein-alanine N-acetyltransferase